ncbi:MAG TPA: class I SAM-dependent methyltransferase [Thermoanaerobaculia bacterium]|nr:class I SAM-dependent methyltransferase [Thermoanaerobaculia bacterium]
MWAEPSIEPLHRRIAAEIPIEEGRLLDVGCGPGNLDRLLAAQRPGLLVVGVDESETMIRRAARRHLIGVMKLEFRGGAVEGLDFREEFDFALSVLSFHHWEEPEAGLEAVRRALKPGGRFWIYEGDPEAPREELRRDQRPLFGWLRLPEGLVRKALRGHGFTASEADRVVRPAVARTSFRTCEISRSGSMLRISMAREA